MKAAILILALILPLQGCAGAELILIIPYELGKAVVDDLRAGASRSDERRKVQPVCELTDPGDIAECMARTTWEPIPEKKDSWTPEER